MCTKYEDSFLWTVQTLNLIVFRVLFYDLLVNFSDFDSLNEEDVAGNNQLAFDVAEREFGIQPVTTGKEMAANAEPDKLLMVLYLSKFFETFRKSPLNNSGQSLYCYLFQKDWSVL